MREGQQVCWECTWGEGHHDHLVCVECGRTIPVYNERLERLQQAMCRKHGFTQTDHTFIIRGRCRDCVTKGTT